MAPRPDAATGLLLELYRDRDTDAAARVMFREIEPQLKRLYPATFEYNDGEGNVKQLPLFGELVEAAFYYSDHAESDDSMPKQTPKFAPGANGARMARAPTGLELKEVMRSHGTNASMVAGMGITPQVTRTGRACRVVI